MDGGTVGASGIYGVGRDSVGLADLHFRATHGLEAADVIAVEPVSGAAQAQRVVIDECPVICKRYPAPDGVAPPATDAAPPG